MFFESWTSTVRIVLLAALVTPVGKALTQTDYYNTDAGRPVQIEDAFPVERRAFEIQAAPLRLERARGGVYRWGIEPSLAYGILPRAHVEVGVPFVFVDAGSAGRASGVAGVEIEALHNLNAETSIPALGVAGSVLLPVGALAPDDAIVSAKAMLTRTFHWARFHVNGEYTFGSRPDAAAEASGAAELSRWMAGIAVDRTFPLRSTLVTAELVAREPLVERGDVAWSAGAGLRHQTTPRWAVDGGFGRVLTGDDRAWYITVGAAWAVGLPWRP